MSGLYEIGADLGTCKHGTPTLVPCPTCDAAYGPVGASDKAKVQYLYGTIGKLEAQLAEALAILKIVEWRVQAPDGEQICPMCAFPVSSDHRDDCRLKKALGNGGNPDIGEIMGGPIGGRLFPR